MRQHNVFPYDMNGIHRVFVEQDTLGDYSEECYTRG